MDVAFSKRFKDFILQASDGKMKLTHFLTDEEQDIVSSLVQKEDGVNVVFFGGFEGSERRRAILFPSFMDKDKVASHVAIFKINPIGTQSLTHPQILGSLMGLGIDRFIIGDILAQASEAIYFAACSEFVPFLIENFTRVGRYDIFLTDVTDEHIVKAEKFEAFNIIISSWRLDVLVKSIMNCARDKAIDHLNEGHVKLNNMVDKKPSRLCHIGDTLSIKRHGRFKLALQDRKTKSGKFVVTVQKYL